MERLKTLVPGLDEVLHGGIPELAAVLLTGAPGSGKTILAQNIMFNVSRDTGRKVIYFTTISEPQIKVIRYQQQFSFFDPGMFMDSVIFYDTSTMIRQDGYGETIQIISEMVREHQPALVVIDSLKAIADRMPSAREFREFISDLSLHLSMWGCTVLLLGEYLEEELLRSPEATIVDGIIYLYGTEEKQRQKRFLRVLKMRGTEFSPGEHTMLISGDGTEIYPRLNPVVNKQSYEISSRRLPAGIAVLDRMMQGGVPAGSTTLVSGPPGSGKSLLALRWLVQGCRDGEPGLLLTFDESPAQLIENTRSFSWDLSTFIGEGLLKILHLSPIEVDVDRFLHQIQETAPERYRRVVVDSITTFEVGMADKIKYKDYLWGMADFFKQQGVALFLLNEIPDLFEAAAVTQHGISYVADNIIIFQYLKDNFNLRRLIGVLKMRSSGHRTELHEFVVGENGPAVLEQPMAYSAK